MTLRLTFKYVQFVFLVALLSTGILLLPSVHAADELTWQQLKETLQANSLVFKSEAMDVDIAKQQEKEALSQYIPQVGIQANSEYLDDLAPTSTTNANSGVSNIGDTFIVNQSAIQHSAVLSAQVTLLDFGKRKAAVRQSKAVTKAELEGAKLKVKEVYMQALPVFAGLWEVQEQLRLYNEQLALQQNKYSVLQRLQAAGEIGKLPVFEQALSLLDIQQNIERLEQQRIENFQRLERFTYTSYDVKRGAAPKLLLTSTGEESVALNLDTSTSPDFSKSPELKELDARMEQKNWEIYTVKRERWAPSLNAYGRLISFGSDQSSLTDSLENFDLRNSRLGLVLQVPLSQALSYKAKEDRLKLELEQMKLQQMEAEQQLQMEWRHNRERLKALPDSEKVMVESSRQAKELQTATDRLKMQQVVSTLDTLNTRIKVIDVMLGEIRNTAERWLLSERHKLLDVDSPVPALTSSKERS